MKCDRGADAWNKFEEIADCTSMFSYQSWPTCAAKHKRGVRQSLANFFLRR